MKYSETAMNAIQAFYIKRNVSSVFSLKHTSVTPHTKYIILEI